MEKLELTTPVDQNLKLAIFDSLGEGITIVNRELQIIWVNPAIEKWAGPLEELKGKYCYKAYLKREAPCDDCPSTKVLRTGEVQKSRQKAYDKFGNVKYFEYTSTPLVNEKGRTIGVIELATDLTEKIELEYKLKEVKDKLQVVFDNIEDGISIIDKNCQILRVNKGILKMFNKRDFSEVIGKKCFAEYYKSEGMCSNCSAQKTFEDGNPYHVTRIWHISDKGRVVLDISTFPIKDKNGEVIQVIEYIKNITDRVKLEDQLLYQERLAGVGELAAGIAHEIRNPLGNIVASAQFCLGKYRLHELARKHLRIILKNAENANGIVKDLLDFAKPTEISYKLGNIGEVIGSACNLVKTRCSKDRVRLTKRISKRLPKILLDEKHLEEAFLNFILNGLDAMSGGGRLTITAYPDSEKNEVAVSFSDTGEGIPPEILSKIFDPFFTTKDKGVGLGLTLTRQIINYHKGTVEIKSEVSKGTEIIVRLPILRESVGGGHTNLAVSHFP